MKRRSPGGRRRRVLTLLTAAASGACAYCSEATAQTSLTGSSLALKSASSNTLSGTGYVGTYLTVPAGGATVNFTINATASTGASAAPHMNLAVADSLLGFSVASTSATNYTTANVALPAGTYFIRDERDYPGNSGASRSFTVNNLSVNTVVGSAATFSNSSTDTNARTAADTYIQNFRKGAATVALTGPGSVPLLAGTPIQVDLARHAFNFGTEVPGNTPSDISSYLGSNGTTLQNNYQSRLNQNFNAIVPGNGGKWGNNEFTRNAVTMSGVDTTINYAQSHNMRLRMHNLIWGDNSFNGQQPPWVLNDSGTGLLDQAQAGNTTAANDLRAAISSRIAYYINAGRAPKIAELDVYNESLHTPQYRNVYGYGGIAGIYNEAASAAAAAGASTKMFTNEYNIFQDGTDSFANWYTNEIESIRNAGGNVGGVGMQYYPNTTIGTANNQHSAARMMAVLNNLSTQGLPIALTEFGVKSGGEAIAPTVLEDSVRLSFGTPNATGFMMWGFDAAEGLFAPAAAFYDANWNITSSGKKWQDLLGIVDWDGNPNNAWDTNLASTVTAGGALSFTGFYGDYYLRNQTSGAYDMTLTKGAGNYNVAMATPPTWSLWNSAASGNWSTVGNWSAGGSPNAAGSTAYFGPATSTRTVNIDSPKTLGMLVFDSANPYAIKGSATITLAGFNVPAGHAAAIYVVNGNHTIDAPLALSDDLTVTVAPPSSTLTLSNLQTTAANIVKAGAGKLVLNHLCAGAVHVAGGSVQILPDGTSSGVSHIASLDVDPGASLDLTNNKLVTASAVGVLGTGNTYTGVTGLIQSGRAGGPWTGSGIITSQSQAATSNFTNIGVASASQVKRIAATATTTWAGQTVSGTDTLVMYTYGGDANLDGKINVDDYTRIDFNVPLGVAGWYNGDFNYDGKINVDDYTIIDFNVGIQGAAFPTGSGNGLNGVTAVPEPASISLLAIGAAALMRRSRKRRVGR